MFSQGIASFLFLFRTPDRTICFGVLSIWLLCILPSKFHLVIQTQYRCYHVWQLLLTRIELFISIVICLPLPAPPGNTCRLLSLILLLLKIFLTTLIFKHCHEMTGFLLWIGTYCISCVVQQTSRVKDLSSLVRYDDSCLAAIRHVQSITRVVRPRPNIRSHSFWFLLY